MTRSGAVLLPNGWSLRPAGRQAKLGDFPVVIAEHPSEPVLAVLHAGYGEHEVDHARGRHRQGDRPRRPATRRFAGLAWSPDGKRLFVGGGFDDVIYRFDHADGLLSNRPTISCIRRSPGRRSGRSGVPAGLAVSGDGKTLWVANAFGHSVARFDLDSGKMVARAPLVKDDSYPYGLAWDEARDRLYVSLWDQAEVAVIDTETGEVVGHWPTQEHPNEMLLARGGRCSTSPTPTATPSRSSTPRRARRSRRSARRSTPRPRRAARPARWPRARRVDALRRQRQHERPGRGQRQGARREHAARLHPDGLVSDLGPGRARTARRSTWPTARGRPRRPTARGRTRWPGARARPASTSPALPGDALDHPDARARSDGRLLEDRLRVQPAEERATRPPSPARRRRRATRSRRRSATPRRSPTASTSSRRTGLTTRSSATSPRATASRASACSPRRSRPNHHALVREFVLLDNFYVDGEVSADGHEWSMGAYATDFVEKTWPLDVPREPPGPVSGRRGAGDRPAGGRLPLGQGRREGGQLPQLRRVHQERATTPDEPATTDGRGPPGSLRPQVPQLRPRVSRREACRPLPRRAGRVREGRRDAPADRPPPAERPHRAAPPPASRP